MPGIVIVIAGTGDAEALLYLRDRQELHLQGLAIRPGSRSFQFSKRAE